LKTFVALAAEKGKKMAEVNGNRTPAYSYVYLILLSFILNF